MNSGGVKLLIILPIKVKNKKKNCDEKILNNRINIILLLYLFNMKWFYWFPNVFREYFCNFMAWR